MAIQSSIRIALLMNQNSYAGREYLQQLLIANVPVDIISIGSYPVDNKSEIERCGGLWNPPAIENLLDGLNIFSFPSLNSEALQTHLLKSNYVIGIQGGTGILKQQVIERFSLGILNFHPGDLPEYRGCSAPEWQVWDGKKVVCTCHLVDEGIDSGKIYKKQVLALDYTSYHRMRATVYPEMAKFVASVTSEILAHGRFVNNPITQDELKAVYRKYIGEEKIKEIEIILSKGFLKK